MENFRKTAGAHDPPDTEIRVDSEREQLLRGGTPLALRPKTWKVLSYLLDRPGRVVSKRDLLDAVWPETTVDEKVVAISVGEIRRALGDSSRQPRFLQTVHGRGFRLLVDLRAQGQTTRARDDRIFVGREEELAELERDVADAIGGRGRAVTIAGNAGIGKSRLLEQLAERVGGQSEWLLGRCYPGGDTPAFWPWLEIIEAYLQRRSLESLREWLAPLATDLAQLSPTVQSLFPASPRLGNEAVESGRARLFASIVSFLRHASARAPLLIAIEDMHWADASTLTLLGVVARSVADSRVCLVITHRAEEAGLRNRLREVLSPLAAAGAWRELRLSGLTDTQVANLASELAGQSLPEGLVESLARRTEGSPFFIEQMIRYWSELGLVDRERPGLRSVLVGDDLPLPPALLDTVRIRLDRLDRETIELLARVAVCGTEIPAAVLDNSGWERARIDAAVDEGIRAGLIHERSGKPPVYRFTHALIAEVLLAGAGPTRRGQWHLDAAEALAAAGGSPGGEPHAQMARHFFAAAELLGDRDVARRAVEAATHAARSDAEVFAFERAAGHFEMALAAHELAKSDDEIARCHLLVEHADALLHCHRIADSRECFARAAELAHRLRLGKELAHAVLGQTVWNLRPQPSHVADVGAIEDALALLREDEPALQARLMARLATTLIWQGDTSSRPQELSRAALALGERSGDEHALGLILADRLWTLWDPDHLAERLQISERCAGLAQRFDRKVLELYARGWQLLDMLRSGDLTAADAHLERHTELIDEIGQGGFHWATAMYRATRALLAGDFATCEPLIQEAREIGSQVEPRTAMLGYGLQLTALRREQGRLAEMKPLFDMLMSGDSAMPLRWLLPAIHAELGDREATRESFEEVARQDFRDLPLRDERLGGFGYAALLGEACIYLDDRRRAAILYQLLSPYASQWIVISVFVACFGSVARILGGLAATMEDWTSCEHHFEAALRAHAGAPPLLVRTQIDYATALQRRPDSEAKERASELSRAARRTAESLGMTRLIERME